MPYWRVQQLQAQAYAEQGQPIIKVDGKLRFSLPGEPLFPQLGDDTILKPTLEWLIGASEAASFDAEVGYVSGGMSWQAAYNVVASEAGEDRIDLAGWVTIDNHCGTDFAGARIKLVAGDVAKVEEQDQGYQMAAAKAMRSEMDALDIGVTSKPFSDYHLYTLPRPTLLRDHETKQEAFLDARGVTCVKRLVYDGLAVDAQRYRGWSPDNIRNQREFGTASNPKVWVMREFVNAAANHLGMPLPAGRMRFYLRDADGQLEFTGENDIDHTPADEKVRVYTGNAFDVVGERRQTDYHLDLEHNQLDETFSITVRNHREQPAEVTVVEHLYRWVNWEVRANSQPFAKRDSRTIEYPVTVPAKGEKTVTYTAHYSW
jgi:hypothetical protein